MTSKKRKKGILKKLKNPKLWLWITIGGLTGFITFHFIGLALGIIGGAYIGDKVPKRKVKK